MQSQALGFRVGTELSAIRSSLNEATEDLPNPPPRKKRRIIVHSSPYVRCIQTSIALVAGLSQQSQPQRTPLRTQRSSIARSPQSNESPTIPEEESKEASSLAPTLPLPPPMNESQRIILRIDSFLGEWLSPSYFDSDNKPPASEILVDKAKEYLKTPAEEIKGADLSSTPIHDIANIDWDSKAKEATGGSLQEKTGLRAMAAAGHAMAKRPRNFSFEAGVPRSTPVRPVQRLQYAPPIPTYSIAPQDAIPIGFVAHARDACVDVDFKWDSEKQPLEWGNGGPYDEEWAAMHRRFRNGLEKMLAYYSTSNEDEEIVLVLVTHQAGCNALIRLMTGAPALHDVGTSSLTLAVQRPSKPELAPLKRTSSKRRGSLDLGLSDDYEMRIIASTEHLRGGSNPLGLNSPRLGKSPAFASKRAVGADSPEGFSIGDSLSWRPSSGHGITRSQSQRTYASDEKQPISPGGLWGTGTSDCDENKLEPNGTNNSSVSGTTDCTDDYWGMSSNGSSRLAPDNFALPVRSASQRGLWGGESGVQRSRSPGKRRWTAVDRSP